MNRRTDSRKGFTKEHFIAGCIVGGSISGMVIAFFLALADYASKPAVHTADIAVLDTRPPLTAVPDQECATDVSLSGPAPDLFVVSMAYDAEGR